VEAAELAARRQLDRVDEIRHVAPLRAGLIHPSFAADRVRERAAFGDRHRAGLLAVDVLAGFRRDGGCRRVPAVAGGDEDRVDVFSRQQLVQVGVHGAVFVAVLRVRHAFHELAALFPNVTDRDELHIVVGEHVAEDVLPSRPDTDRAEDDPFARRDRAVFAEELCRDGPGHREGGAGP
jgi:hypothetical protein